MIACNVCHYWTPKQWEVYKYVDTVAMCRFKGKHTTAGETCESARLTPPPQDVQMNVNTLPSKDKRATSVSACIRTNVPVGEPEEPEPVAGEQLHGTEEQLYTHQKEAIERFHDKAIIALFMSMGCGKSRVILEIAAKKFHRGEIDALLYVGPNEVHAQFGYQQVTKWLPCKYELQVLFGRGGQKESYPFTQGSEYLQVVCVNIDTFSTPAKWEDIVAWAVHRKTMIVVDEATCFAPGTLVDTPSGPVAIETIKKGDELLNCTGVDHARADATRTRVGRVVRINRIFTSADHLFFTSRGWRRAEDIQPGDRIVGTSEGVRLLRNGVCPTISPEQESTFLRNELLREVAHDVSTIRLFQETHEPAQMDRRGAVSRFVKTEGTSEAPGSGRTHEDHYAKALRRWVLRGTWWKRALYATADMAGRAFRWCVALGVRYSYARARRGLSDQLQGRHGATGQKDSDRGGRSRTQQALYEGERPEEAGPVGTIRVDSVACYEPTDRQFDKWRSPDGGLYFYDVGVARHPSYSVSGMIVHNCIKNPNAKRTERMLYAFNDTVRRGKRVVSTVPKTVARAVLTGTPVSNGPLDVWSVFEFLQPNYFGRNLYSFQAHFGMFTTMAINDRVIKVPLTADTWKAVKKIMSYGEANAIFGVSEDTFNTIHSQDKYEGPYKHADELKKLMDPVSMFVSLEDVVDMPPRTYTTRQLFLEGELKRCYEEMERDLVTQYKDHTAIALSKLTAIIRLQQICSGFVCDRQIAECKGETGDVDRVAALFGLSEEEDLTPDEIQWIGNSNQKLDALYRDVEEADKPLIIITRFSAEAARIFDDLEKQHRCCLMTGWKRVGSVEAFQEGQYDIMVANSAVVARGFNLQRSHTMLFYSNTFSLETRLQAEGRIFRIGQKSPCVYVDYAYAGTVDQKITAALSMKRNLLDYIRGASVEEVISNE